MALFKNKQENLDLLQGHITTTLLQLALPIMTTGFIQMAYSLADVFWLCRVESGLVAAGTCGIVLWMCDGFSSLTKVGAEVKTAHCLGRKEEEEARANAVISLQSTFLIGVLICLIFCGAYQAIIGFFHFQNPHTVQAAETYLKIVGFGLPFAFVGRTLSVISMANGNSKMPFLVNTLGLVANIILDPLLIFVLDLGVAGAAYATAFSQITVCIVMFIFLRKQAAFRHLHLCRRLSGHLLLQNLKLGYPVALQTILVSMVAMGITRIVNNFAEAAIAAQRLGVQIESLSWLTAESFGGALTAMVAQNYAAMKMQRTYNVIKRSLWLIIGLGSCITLILYFYPHILLGIFTGETDVLHYGTEYLRIISYSQVFMCLEIIIAAVYNAFGRTKFPAVVGVLCTALRIPVAMYLSSLYGTDGIWWALTICTILHSFIMIAIIVLTLSRMKSEYGLT